MRKILIADDEPKHRVLIRVSLEGEDYQILEAEHGEETIEVIQKEKPDLVILDALMPKVDGFEICRRIKADPKLRFIKVIMLTAKAQEVDMELGEKVGVDDYITKPFNPRELLTKVKEVLK